MRTNKIIYSALVICLLFASCSSLSDDYIDYPSGGDFTEIGTGTISSGNLQIVISDKNSIFSTMEITINDNYSGPSVDFTVESGDLPGLTFSEYFTPREEMLRISNGGEYSENTFFVKIPISTTSEEIPLAFAYNESTESLEPLPIISSDEFSITTAFMHFTQCNYNTSLKSTFSTDIKTSVDIVIGTIVRAALETKNYITSGFIPGEDDWEFTNYGSFIERAGNCAGHSLSALFYYDYKTWANQVELTNLYDRDNQIWEDNTLGIRLVSEVQNKDFETSEGHIWANFIKNNQNATADSYINNYHNSAFTTATAQMLVTNKPIYTGVFPTNSSSGHAVLIIGANLTKKQLFIADPNYPGITKSTILQADGYYDYMSSESANSADNISYKRFTCLGFSQIANWGNVAKHWKELNKGTIGDKRFPICDYKVTFNAGSEDESTSPLGAIDKVWLGGLSVSKKHSSIRLSLGVKDVDGTRMHSNIWIRNGNKWIKSGLHADYVDLDLNEHNLYNSTIGIFINRRVNVGGKFINHWIDFKWLNISEISISPEKMNGDINTEYSWEITLGDPPVNTRFEWNFGDGSNTLVVKSSNFARHTYTEEGIFPIMVMAYDDDTNESRGVATGKATIGDAEFELIIKNNRTGEIIEDKADICTYFDFEIKVPAWTPGTYKLRYDLGDNDIMTTTAQSFASSRSFFEIGTYAIKVWLIDENSTVVSEISRELTITENDFFDMITPFTHVSAAISSIWTTHYLDDGSEAQMFSFNPWYYDNAPVVHVSWSGRSFSYHQIFEDFEVKMEGTLSASCWNIEAFKASYKQGRTEYTLETSNIPVQGPPCPLWPPDQIVYGTYGLELKQKFTLSGQIYKISEQKWVSYTHSDFSETSSFEITFYNR